MPHERPVIAVIGAGPSLDYCELEIANLISQGAKFLVADSIAAGLLRKYPRIDALVFTVEIRRHLYIQRAAGASVMAYNKANLRNLRAKNISRFKISGEEGDLPELHSPGTVLGVMLSYATRVAREIYFFGADFSYIDNQVYSRFIDPHVPQMNRLATRENWQLEMVFKKTSGAIMKNGFAIRTSFELMQSRENMRDLMVQAPNTLRFFEYSPVGFDSARVAKRIPG